MCIAGEEGHVHVSEARRGGRRREALPALALRIAAAGAVRAVVEVMAAPVAAGARTCGLPSEHSGRVAYMVVDQGLEARRNRQLLLPARTDPNVVHARGLQGPALCEVAACALVAAEIRVGAALALHARLEVRGACVVPTGGRGIEAAAGYQQQRT